MLHSLSSLQLDPRRHEFDVIEVRVRRQEVDFTALKALFDVLH